ncbi:hypothetical protein Ahy_B04g070487 isoform F [Arachis hypogaea]|nr:hypothetical protein Ahy_B04g070487 isoform F [Arachis hypogaea]
MGRSIIHISVLHRHASIFNLIHEVGPIKDFIVTFLDDEGNNLLHCAAKLPPPNRLNLVSGAALQMMLELSWFEVYIIPNPFHFFNYDDNKKVFDNNK